MLPMTSAAPVALDHGVLPPTPRRVERRPGTRGVMWPVLLFIMPHTLIGLGLASSVILKLGWMVLGHGGADGLHQLAGLFLVALFWNGVVGAFWYHMFFRALGQRWLVKHGYAVPGRVTSQSMGRGRGAQLEVKYTYRLPSSSVELQGCMHLDVPLRQPAPEGNVTVVFSPAHPQHSIIYDCAAYQVATSR